MVITPEISTIINTCIGIFISVFTAYLTHKVKQRDEEMVRYRKEREAREAEEIRRREEEDQSRDQLTLGMARTMLLSNYDGAVTKGYYTITERDVYHELYEGKSFEFDLCESRIKPCFEIKDFQVSSKDSFIRVISI